MTHSHDRAYRDTLHKRLLSLGFERDADIGAFPKVALEDANTTISVYRMDQDRLFISNGCVKWPRGNNKFEFVFHVIESEELSIEILNYVIYYHMAGHKLMPRDVVEIGKTKFGETDFKYIYFSQPWFLPVEVCEIDVEDSKYDLIWLYPIYKEEYDVWKHHGAFVLEKAMWPPGKSLFTDRSDLAHIEQFQDP